MHRTDDALFRLRRAALLFSRSGLRSNAILGAELGATTTIGLRAGLVLGLLLSACGSPMAYPRTADLHRGLSGAVRTNVSQGDARATYTKPNDGSSNPGADPEPESTTLRANASSSVMSGPLLAQVLGLGFSAEGSLAHGFSDAVALGGWMSLELLGAELRLQPLSQRDGAPLSATVALGAAHVGLLPSFQRRLLEQGFGARAGVDLGLTAGRLEVLAGAYGSIIRRRRNFQAIPDDVEADEAAPGVGPSLMVVRDELKLSVPFGIAVHGTHGALVFGLVPEWTLDASVREARCDSCDRYSVTAFVQEFAIYLTIGVEAWRSGEAPAVVLD